MRALLEPVAEDQGSGRHGAGRDDVGLAHGPLQVGGGLGRDLGAGLGGERGGGLGAAGPQAEARLREARAVGAQQGARHRARPDHQHLPGVGAGQAERAQERVAGRLPLGQEAQVHERLEGAVAVRQQRGHAVDALAPPGGVAREDGGGLHQEAEAGDPGGPVEERVGGAGQEHVLHLGAGPAVAVLDGAGDREPVQAGLHLPADERDAHSRPSAARRSRSPSGPRKRCAAQPRSRAASTFSSRSSAKSRAAGGSPVPRSTAS